MPRQTLITRLALLALVVLCSNAYGLYEPPPPLPPTFLEKYWWHILVEYMLCSLGFAFRDEERFGGMMLFFICSFCYLVYWVRLVYYHGVGD